MREYHIAYFRGENERAIRRTNGEEVRRLSPEKIRTKNKTRAKRFFHEDTAVAALVLIKSQWELKEEEPYRPEQPKLSWDEL